MDDRLVVQSWKNSDCFINLNLRENDGSKDLKLSEIKQIMRLVARSLQKPKIVNSNTAEEQEKIRRVIDLYSYTHFRSSLSFES
jgi:hypothetical protein